MKENQIKIILNLLEKILVILEKIKKKILVAEERMLPHQKQMHIMILAMKEYLNQQKSNSITKTLVSFEWFKKN